jgi:hypothetical protein
MIANWTTAVDHRSDQAVWSIGQQHKTVRCPSGISGRGRYWEKNEGGCGGRDSSLDWERTRDGLGVGEEGGLDDYIDVSGCWYGEQYHKLNEEGDGVVDNIVTSTVAMKSVMS